MDVRTAYPSKYLSAVDLAGKDTIAKIERVEYERLGDDNKPVVTFTNGIKKMALNKVNSQTIAKVLGSYDTDHWQGKSIVLFPTQTDLRGEQVECIRVRLRAPELPKPKIVEEDEIPF